MQTHHANYVWYNKRPFVATLSGHAIARACFDTLMRDGIQAKMACERKITVQALENIIESNILMSGLGFENVGCSVAHAIGNAITVLPEGERMMHGERVGFGVVCQMIAEHYDPELTDQVLRFCVSVGLPVCFENLSNEMTEEKLHLIAKESMDAESWQACSITYNEEDIVQIMIMADALGHTYLSGK